MKRKRRRTRALRGHAYARAVPLLAAWWHLLCVEIVSVKMCVCARAHACPRPRPRIYLSV